MDYIDLSEPNAVIDNEREPNVVEIRQQVNESVISCDNEPNMNQNNSLESHEQAGNAHQQQCNFIFFSFLIYYFH